MDQDRLRQLASPDEVRNELVKQFTKHIEEEQEDPDDSVVKVKLVVVGPAGGGKTSWVTKLIQNKFNQAQQPTIGAKFSSQGVAIEDFVYNFDIWDVSGDEWYKSLVPMYLQYAQAVVICYDTSSAKSFEEVKSWIQYVKDVAEKGLVLCLVGMKSDLSKEESRQEGVEVTGVDTETVRKFFVDENGLEKDFFFPSVSAKTGENVHDVLLTVAEAMHERGVKAPRGSVMDPETAYRFANKAAQNQNTLLKTTNNNQNNTLLKIVDSERVDQAKEKMSECYVYMHKLFGGCFESSKKTAKKTFESTKKNVKEMSKTMDRRSRKIGADLQKRTAQLIRKTQRRKSDEENDGSVNVYGNEERDNNETTGPAPKIERLKG